MTTHHLRIAAVLTAWLTSCPLGAGARAETVSNDTLVVELGGERGAMPCITRCAWKKTGQTLFTSEPLAGPPADLLPSGFKLPEAAAAWRETRRTNFLQREATLPVGDGLEMTWAVELPPQGPYFRAQVRLKNTGTQPRPVAWFPAWRAQWSVPGRADWVHGWKGVTYASAQAPLGKAPFVAKSTLHSSQQNGFLPVWFVGGEAGRLGLSLEWCGGWSMALAQPAAHTLALDLRLPPEETQLVLAPGEMVAGPVLTVWASGERDEREARAAWHHDRLALRRLLYRGPAPSYPFAWNHWYSVRLALTDQFLAEQFANATAWGFDAFILDAGWYSAIGDWRLKPDLAKTFESQMQGLAQCGTIAGLWSCPQLTSNLDDPRIDPVAAVRKHMSGSQLFDLAGMDFTPFLLEHVTTLTTRYHAGWWKYDQTFFDKQTRHGMMKNVIAWQEALKRVRAACPNLIIESCMGGGRMINDLSTLLADIHWLRDGAGTGPAHARENLSTVLGALESLPPWMCFRWTNRIDENAAAGDEFLRAYCRSAMPGVWGVSADLAKISPHQRELVLREAANYRRLNALKPALRYDLLPAQPGAQFAGVVFYDAPGRRAAVLLSRWDGQGDGVSTLKLSGLDRAATFTIEDADGAPRESYSGEKLASTGLAVKMKAEQLSRLLFLSAQTP